MRRVAQAGWDKAFRTEPTIQETIVEAFEQLKKKKGKRQTIGVKKWNAS
jgi:hypothetical protein